jgi:hypothetical protein
MKNVEADVTPLKELQRCGARNGCFEERCGSSCGSLEEDAKVWCKKRLLGRKRCGSRNSCFQWEGQPETWRVISGSFNEASVCWGLMTLMRASQVCQKWAS